ncbi:MAG TPA: TolC family protein [Thermoanaerobaculia bacterium]
MKRAIAPLLLLITLGAEAQTRLTFDEALTRAMTVNNVVERSRSEIGVAEAQKLFLLSAVLPRITMNGALTRNSIEQTFGEGDEGITILPRNDWNYNVTLSQPIFAGRRELRAYSQARLGVDNAVIGVRSAEDAILLRVASSYLAAVNADARIEVERRNIEIAQRSLNQARAFYEAGEVTRVDVLRAETGIKAAQRLLAAAEQQREGAVAQLREDLQLDGEIAVASPERSLPPLPSEAELIARATGARPDVDLAENNLRIAELEVSKQRGYWLPTVTFDGGFIHQRTPFPANRYSYGALRFNVPIFQAGEVIARVAGAKEREKQAELQLEETQLTAREDVRRAFADLESAATGLSLANDQMAAAQAEYDQVFELYRAQEATSLDLAASEASLANARRAVAEETLNRDLAALRVWFAAGALKEAVGIGSNQQ